MKTKALSAASKLKRNLANYKRILNDMFNNMVVENDGRKVTIKVSVKGSVRGWLLMFPIMEMADQSIDSRSGVQRARVLHEGFR